MCALYVRRYTQGVSFILKILTGVSFFQLTHMVWVLFSWLTKCEFFIQKILTRCEFCSGEDTHKVWVYSEDSHKVWFLFSSLTRLSFFHLTHVWVLFRRRYSQGRVVWFHSEGEDTHKVWVLFWRYSQAWVFSVHSCGESFIQLTHKVWVFYSGDERLGRCEFYSGDKRLTRCEFYSVWDRLTRCDFGSIVRIWNVTGFGEKSVQRSTHETTEPLVGIRWMTRTVENLSICLKLSNPSRQRNPTQTKQNWKTKSIRVLKDIRPSVYTLRPRPKQEYKNIPGF